MKLPLLFLLLLTAVLAQAESHEDIIGRAFESLDKHVADHWSFTETSESTEGVFVATFDPRLPEAEQWALLSVDGRPPTDEETSEFLEQKQANDSLDDEDSEGGGVESMFIPGTVTLVEETDRFWLFNFRPAADSEEERKFMDAVDGTMKVVKDGHYVAWLELKNREPFKPGKGIKIDTFHTRLAFSPPVAGGTVLPSGVSASVLGRAFLVVKIDETENVSYSNYERVIE